MPLFLDLARRAAAEVERHTRAVANLVTRSAEIDSLRAQLVAYGDRIDRLERALTEQAGGLTAARGQVDSLIGQLNDRLLPGIDERMDETERDLTRLATRLVRAGQDTIRHETRLTAAEQRVGDLRGKVGQLEQRTGIWRELQANVARLGDDIDGLRAQLLNRLGGQEVLP